MQEYQLYLHQLSKSATLLDKIASVAGAAGQLGKHCETERVYLCNLRRQGYWPADFSSKSDRNTHQKICQCSVTCIGSETLSCEEGPWLGAQRFPSNPFWSYEYKFHNCKGELMFLCCPLTSALFWRVIVFFALQILSSFKSATICSNVTHTAPRHVALSVGPLRCQWVH